MSVSHVAAALGISWHAANKAILNRAEQTITGNPHRFDEVEILGVNDSRARPQWSGPASVRAPEPLQEEPYQTWLAARDESWRGRVEEIAMDGFN